MPDQLLLEKGKELGIVVIDMASDRITYRLGKEKQYRWSDPEEPVRAELVLDLIFNYRYSPLRMETEVAIPGRTPDNWADVVVFKDDRRRDPYITVEAASPNVTPAERAQKAEQLFGYANALASEFALFWDGRTQKRRWRVRGEGGLERERNTIPDLPQNYGETPQYLYHRAGEHDLETVNANELARIFDQCHNELWSGGRFDPTEAFDEMSKLMFAKLFDEQRTPNNQPYSFQWGERETDIMVAQRVIDRYNGARANDPDVFIQDIRAEPRKIANVVKLLQRVSLARTDPDAKGRAFEQFLGEVFRGRLGQYFTRREIVDFLVDVVRPTRDDFLLDPACGSGGFLVYSMKRVFNQVERDYSGDIPTIIEHQRDFARRHLFGVEINEKIARVAMMDMVVHEDGHSNIEIRTAFDNRFAHNAIRDGAFTLVLTNPPFGDHVKRDQRDKLGQAELDDFTLARGKASAKSEVLYIERCARFLQHGGRLGIVLPDGLLSNPSDKFVREYLLEHFRVHAVITLPPYAFRKAGSGMRTSLVFAQKWHETDNCTQDYPIFMALAEHIGYDATARPDSNDLPGIATHYHNGTGALDEKVIRIRRTDVTGSKRLDPLYHYLGPVIEQAFSRIPYPTVTLHEIAGQSIQSGNSPKGGAKYSVGEIPILLVGNIMADGSLALDDLYYADEAFYEANKDKGSIQQLDILIAKDGATTGKVGLVPADFDLDRCLINEHIFKITVGAAFPGEEAPTDAEEAKRLKTLNTYYVFFFLKSWLGQQQINREVSGGAQGGITKTFVENIRIPRPPIDERQGFVDQSWAEYRRYLDLSAQARQQHTHFEDSLSRQMRNWSGEQTGITEEEFENAVRRVIRRL